MDDGNTPPRQVPGYAEALANGRIRPVPPSAPALLPGTTAKKMFRQFVAGIVISGLGFIVLYNVSNHLPTRDQGLRPLLLLVSSSAPLIVALLLLLRMGNRNVQELAHGYTTLRLTLGGFFPKLRFSSPTQRRVPWDYRGVWVLDDRTGAVISAPDPQVDPPGFFPSPNRQGKFELWSGLRWTGDFRDTPP